MAQLAAWLVVCLTIALVLRHRPTIAVAVVITLWVLLPAAAAPLVTGQVGTPIAVHPATWLILAVLGIQLLRDPDALLAALTRLPFVGLSLLLVCGVAVLSTYLEADEGLRLLIDQLLAPVLVFWLLIAFGPRDPRGVRALVGTLLGLLGIVSALAVAQWLLDDPLVFGSTFADRDWWDERGSRWMGTLDHPLSLSTFAVIVAPLVLTLRRTSVQLGLLSLGVVAVLVSQSRTGLVAVLLVLVYVLVRARVSLTVRIGVLAVYAIGAWVAVRSGVLGGVSARVEDDTGSTEARVLAVQVFFENIGDYLLVGRGFTSSYEFSTEQGLQTSLESSLLMYAVDIGAIFALLWFLTQVVLVAGYLRRSGIPGITVSGIAILVLPQSYSALASSNAIGALSWTVLGIGVAAYLHRRDAPDGDETGDEPASDEATRGRTGAAARRPSASRAVAR